MNDKAFIIALSAGTLLVGGALVAFGMKQGGRYAEAEANYSGLKQEVEGMARVKPYPSEENLEAYRKDVTAFRGKVEGLQNALQEFRPESLEKISPSEFQNRLVAKSAALKELFEEKRIGYPEQFNLGFERYKDELANPNATAKLNYQLEAVEWLFTEIANSETYSIRNVVRESLPSESGGDWLANRGRGPVPLYQSLPLELVILAEEEAINELLNTLSSSKKYFFAIDMVRVSNEKLSPPVRSQADLAEDDEEDSSSNDALSAGGAFGDFAFGEEAVEEEAEAEAEEAPLDDDNAETGKILGQVLGNEALYVGLQLRLLLFQEPAELPEIK